MTPLRRARSLVAVLPLLVLTACSAGPNTDTAGSPQTTDETSSFSGVVGVDWLPSSTPDNDSDSRVTDAVFALGRFWVLVEGAATVIFSSTPDPDEWESTTLESLGVPAASADSAHFAPTEESLSLVVTGAWDEGAPDNPPTPIVLTTTGDGWSADPRAAALVPWTPSEIVSPRYFSYQGLTEAAHHDGSLTLFSTGGWYEPFKTGDESIVTMTLGPDGELRREIVDRPPFGGDGQVRSHGLHTLAGSMTLVTTTSIREPDTTILVVHQSEDGVAWQSTTVTAPNLLGYVDPFAVSSWSTGDTVYIEGETKPAWNSAADEAVSFLLRSTDGVTWRPVDITAVDGRLRGGTDGQRDYVLAPTSFTSGDVWAEGDGAGWELIAEGVAPDGLVISYPGGIAVVDEYGMEYSGPWPE